MYSHSLLRFPLTLLVLLVLAAYPSFVLAENTGVVSVSGGQFMLNGVPFYYAGTNNYYQMVYAADLGLRPYVEEVQTETAGLGLTVLRTWAFNDGASQWNALQTSPGVYQEYVFQGLDYVLHLADQNGLRLILPFVNNWDDYGGMNQYVAWSGTASAHDDFYTDANCRTWYKNHVSTVLNRANTFNGRIYREDPTIFAWELANEPECPSDPTGATLEAWIVEMSAYIKSIDATHLVTTGSQGYYGPAGPAHNPRSWMSSRGCDFIPHHAVATIDFACVHDWGAHWGTNYAESMLWVSDHIDDSTDLLGKPVILEEFGRGRPIETRDVYYQGWYDEVYLAAQAGEAAGGSNFWILYHDDYEDYDGFGVYCPEDTSTCDIIATEAERMNALIVLDTTAPTVTDVEIVNLTLAHTHEYAKHTDDLELTATVTDDIYTLAASDITADFSALLVGGGAAVAAEDYAGTTATWTVELASVSLQGDGVKTVTVTAEDGAGNIGSGTDQIAVDNTPPTAITGFTAAPGDNEAELTWSDASGTDTNFYQVMIRSNAWVGYPNYTGGGPVYPADAGAGTFVWQDIGTGYTKTYSSDNSERDIYYYGAFAVDMALNYGLADTGAQDRSTNYWLGDVANVDNNWIPDGHVSVADITKISGTYGESQGSADFEDQCDVGPTDGDGRFGIPLPDDIVEFEDLMIFAMNYGAVSPRVVPFLPLPESTQELALSVEERSTAASGEVELSLILSGNADEVKGLSGVLMYDTAELGFVSARLSAEMSSPLGDVFFWHGCEDGRIQVDLVVLGTDVTAGGSGEVAVLTFVVLSDEYGVEIESADLRGAENRPLEVDLEGFESSPELPVMFRLVQNVPNPFNPVTKVAYHVPSESRVTIRVFEVTGRLVATLVDGVVEPGRHAAIWNGTNDAGESVGSGVYFCTMEAPDFHDSRKMTLLK
jgi:mannan endo-1,4-beta-mannosidase